MLFFIVDRTSLNIEKNGQFSKLENANLNLPHPVFYKIPNSDSFEKKYNEVENQNLNDNDGVKKGNMTTKKKSPSKQLFFEFFEK